jgi:hypothetical protein
MIEQKFTAWKDRIYTMYRNADTADKRAKVDSEITRYNLEAQDKAMGGVPPITEKSLRSAMKEKADKRFIRFGQGVAGN